MIKLILEIKEKKQKITHKPVQEINCNKKKKRNPPGSFPKAGLPWTGERINRKTKLGTSVAMS